MSESHALKVKANFVGHSPAFVISAVAAEFKDTTITLSRRGYNVNAKNGMGIMLLKFGIGDELLIEAYGPKSKLAVESIAKLLSCTETELRRCATKLIKNIHKT